MPGADDSAATDYLALPDDPSMVSVPAYLLAVCIEATPCPHQRDTVCPGCHTEAADKLADYLSPTVPA